MAGLDVTAADRRDLVRRVGIVLQNPFNQISGARYTVEAEIAFGLENLGLARAEMRDSSAFEGMHPTLRQVPPRRVSPFGSA